MPQLWIIAGPNGAGKTTFVSRQVGRRIPVVNPDTIAHSIPRIQGRLDERRAGRLAIERRRTLLSRSVDFAVETTLTGQGGLQFMHAAARAGYEVTLVYIGLESVDLSIERVLARVGRGGHPIPVSAIERRYPDTMAKLARAVQLADRSFILDNSDRRRRLLLAIDGGTVRFRAKALPSWFHRALPDYAR